MFVILPGDIYILSIHDSPQVLPWIFKPVPLFFSFPFLSLFLEMGKARK